MSSLVAHAFDQLLIADPSAVVASTSLGPVTRADLDSAARLVAERLEGIATGRRIALSVRDGVTFLAAFLALARRGDTALLMDAADPQAPRLDLAGRFGASAVLVNDPELSVLTCGGTAGSGMDRAIKLTSGSTGEPSAIAVGDRELLADAAALESTMGIGDGDRVFAAVPMSFSYGVGNLMVPALARGRHLILPDPGPLGLVRAMRVGEPTVLPAVPALLRALLQGSFCLPDSMRLVISAGATLPVDVAVAFRQRFGLPVHAFYGSTESGGISYDTTGLAAERGSVGQPVDGVTVEIRADGHVRIRSGAVGRVLVASANANPDNGVFVAPDLGKFVDGDLFLLGRAGVVFDVGGHKVDPREIERLICELPQVSDASVLPFRDEHGRAVCGAVVAAAGIDADDVRTHCAAVLPSAKVPRRVVLVDSLPRNSRGKIQRDALNGLMAGESDLESQ